MGKCVSSFLNRKGKKAVGEHDLVNTIVRRNGEGWGHI